MDLSRDPWKQLSGTVARVKATLELPDDLMRAVKIRAVEQNRRLKDSIADLLRIGLLQETSAPVPMGRRVQLPLVECAREAQPGQELTAERVAEILTA